MMVETQLLGDSLFQFEDLVSSGWRASGACSFVNLLNFVESVFPRDASLRGLLAYRLDSLVSAGRRACRPFQSYRQQAARVILSPSPDRR